MQMQADLFEMGPCHKTGSVETVLCFRPIVRISMPYVIVKLFEAIDRTCEIKVSDETHKFVMLTIRRPNPELLGLDFLGWGRRFGPT